MAINVIFEKITETSITKTILFFKDFSDIFENIIQGDLKEKSPKNSYFGLKIFALLAF